MSNELDTLLSKRTAPDMPEGLSARIIAEAARTEQGAAMPMRARKLSLLGVFTRLFDGMLPTPQPAWAAAAAVVVLAVGFVIGDMVDFGLVDTSIESDSLSSFMSVEDTFTAQEWV